MKLIVAGSREFTDYQVVCRVLNAHRQQITQIITGGARGADRLGYRWSWKHQVPHRLDLQIRRGRFLTTPDKA